MLCIRQIMRGGSPPDRITMLCGVLDLEQVDYIPRHDPSSTPTAFRGSDEGYAHWLTPINDPLISPINATMEILGQFPPSFNPGEHQQISGRGVPAFDEEADCCRSTQHTQHLAAHAS